MKKNYFSLVAIVVAIGMVAFTTASKTARLDEQWFELKVSETGFLDYGDIDALELATAPENYTKVGENPPCPGSAQNLTLCGIKAQPNPLESDQPVISGSVADALEDYFHGNSYDPDLISEPFDN